MHINNSHDKPLLGFFLLSVISLLLLAGLLIGNTNPAAARIEKLVVIPGATITTDTTWTLANSPYVITNWVVVNAGVTLTIEPGVVVKFNGNIGMNIAGTLDVNGVDGTPVIFTEYRDDTAGGDTNGDGSASTPAPGAWTGMYVGDNANAYFDYAEIRYGGAVFWNGASDGAHYGNLRKDGAGTLILDHTLVTQSYSCGVRFDASSGVNTLTDSTFTFNGGYGVCLYDAANTLTFSGSIFAQNSPWSIYTTPNSSGFSIPPDNILDKPIYVSNGSMTVDSNWSRQVYLLNGLTVNAGVTLTIPSGAVVKFNGPTSMIVYGTLDVNGTDGSPVIFTELRDDTAGGDTNGDAGASTPTPGGWHGMYVTDNGNASFEYAEIRYGGAVFWNGASDGAHYGNLRKDGAGTLTLDHTLVTQSYSCGVRFDGTTGVNTVTDSTFSYNGNYGVCLYDAVNAISFSGSTFTQNTPWSIVTTPKSSGFSIPPDNLLDKPIFVSGGGLLVDSTWSQQVYVTYGFTINAGYSLQIPAGAVLKFMNMTGVTVFGNLDVNGTESLPVIITEFRDDTAGGDSNGDGPASSPAPGAWTGLFIPGGGNASFEYAEIRYGGGYFFNGERDACHYGNLRKDGSGQLTTNHVTSMYSGCAGLWLTGAVTEAEILDSHFLNNNGWGVLFQASASDLLAQRNLIETNLTGGLHINNPGGVNEIIQNTIVANTTFGIQITNDSPALIGVTDANGNNVYGNTSLQIQNLNSLIGVDASHNWWGINPPFSSGITGLVDYSSPLSGPATFAPVYLADVAISSDNIPSSAIVEEIVDYTIDITNNGPRNAYHLVISGIIPNPAKLLTVTATGWDCTQDNSQFSCYLPYLAAASTQSISFSINSAAPSPLSFDVLINQANNDPAELNNRVPISTTILIQVMLPLITR